MTLQSYRREIATLKARHAQRLRPRAPYTLTPLELFERTIGGAPDAWQAECLTSASRQIILNCTRQAGKSAGMAVLGVDTLLSRPNALVVVTSGSERQSKELLRTMVGIYRACGQGPRLIRPPSSTYMELINGSRAIALPTNAATVRGFSKASLVLIDESAYVPDPLYRALRPMLAVSGGRIVLASTPFGRRGYFYQEWSEGGPDWHRISVAADQIARIPPAFLEAERRALGDIWFSQEYFCAFVENLFAVFSFESVMRALSDDVVPLDMRKERSGWEPIHSALI